MQATAIDILCSTASVALVTCTAVAVTVVFTLWSSPRPGPVESPFPRGRLCDIGDATAAGEVAKVSDLPDGWWRSDGLLEDERRAIFAGMSIAVSHASMFPSSGSYRIVEHPAGFPLFLVRGKDRVLRCFHNVCRHRAYPVVSTKRAGCTPVLACRYHGWTYDLQGHLVKAPKFENVKGFRKEANSLLEVNTAIDADGVVRINLSLPPESDAYVDDKVFSRGHLESWEVEGTFNWKMAEAEDAFSLPTVSGKRGNRNITHTKPSVLSDVFALRHLGSSLLITVQPKTAAKCVVHCTLYTSAGLSSATSALLSTIQSDIVRCVSSLEDRYAVAQACESSRPTLHDSVFLEKIKSHRRLERSKGGKVWPSSVGGENHSCRFNIAESLTQELMLKATGHEGSGDGVLSW
ncbi:uncharacterized protein PV07_09026 [Cladophialophora immunda]|uniref:Rieske domain-containing protein n=1 Tax=Cladophialophora immunda TaxID=569365 RepID=A0A0D2C5X0_9EURO|nr:uncharacterized protein PV07_09026 [Cladophialophora immunda]KIW25890.1 hypothetical protein PV07_09026 [Cladophialophora immunda]OQV10696.1 Rieske [2Fe-2S] domain-containing protein [Cladophialophora immunda]